VLSPNDKEVLNNLNLPKKRTIDEVKVIPKVGFGKLLRDFTEFTIITLGVDRGCILNFFLLVFLGYYFSEVR
jgi:hypothetical protein